MRKNYYFILALLFSLVSTRAAAWAYSLGSENDVLTTNYGYALYKYYDFFNGMYSPEDYFSDGVGNRVNGDGCFTLSPDKASFKLNGFEAFQVNKPVEMSNFYIGIGTGAINLRAGVNKDGLHNYGSGSRFLAIGDVKKGQIVVCQWGCTTSRESVCQPSAAISGATACTWTDITDTIHAQQIELGTTSTWEYDPEYPGDEDHAIEVKVPGKADAFSYWMAESDGYFVIELQRDIAVQGLQIWLDGSADEAVSSPTMKLVAVDGTSRQIEFTPGASTLGSDCQVWYGLEDDPALFLEETDEIVRADTTYVLDEEGQPTSEIADIQYTYRQRLSQEDWAVGVAGSNIYDNTPFTITSDDDTDGDGVVVVHAATVSSTGNFSDITDFRVSVNDITLNAPSMTLVGLEGTARIYQIGWSNNTLCGEPFQLKAVVDGEELDANLGDTFEAEQTIGARAEVAGYTDGVLAEEDVMSRGVAFSRKNAEKAEAGKHDWDFVNLTALQYQMIQGAYSDTIAYIRPSEANVEANDTTFYTRDEFYALVEAGTLTEADGVAWNPKDCGWWYESGKSRATLNVIEGGNDANSNGFGYVEDNYVGLFGEGLSVSCPPNANNASCIFIYNNGDLGAYFMSRPTLTFSRSAAQYGEYVLMYLGSGGSNYTNSRWPSLYEVPESELLSVTLQSGGVHVFYIDVYTPEELPYDGVNSVTIANDTKAIYDIAGRRMATKNLHPGLYIIGGRKIVVK